MPGYNKRPPASELTGEQTRKSLQPRRRTIAHLRERHQIEKDSIIELRYRLLQRRKKSERQQAWVERAIDILTCITVAFIVPFIWIKAKWHRRGHKH